MNPESHESDDPFDLDAALTETAAELREGAEKPYQPEADSGQPDSVSAPPAPRPDDAPSSWNAEEKAEWATLTPKQKAAILRRESDYHNGLKLYREEAEKAKLFETAIAPYKAQFPQNLLPHTVVGNLLQADKVLRSGTAAEKQALMRQLIKDYGLSLEGLDAEPAYVDPAVASLQQKLEALESRHAERESQQAEAERKRVMAEVQEFAAKAPHFEAVADDIATIIRGNPQVSLADAYERATWANPTVRKLMIKAEAEAEAAREKSEAAKAARASQASIRSGNTGKSSSPVGSIDDTMRETLAALRAR